MNSKIDINEIRKMIRDIPESHRKNIERVISGEVVKYVICGGCGRTVAEIMKDKKIEPTLDVNGKMWLLAYRYRLDGYLGFQCACGNDSRLATQEKGITGIEKNRVTDGDIQFAMKKIKNNPPQYTKVMKDLRIDNFVIREI